MLFKWMDWYSLPCGFSSLETVNHTVYKTCRFQHQVPFGYIITLHDKNSSTVSGRCSYIVISHYVFAALGAFGITPPPPCTVTSLFPPAVPLTCMSLQSAQPRTLPGRGHILWGTAPAGVAPPACVPPPGSVKPGPPTQSSGPRSCCSGLQIWPQYSRRRTTPWASCWSHRGLPPSICPPFLLRCHRGWQTFLSGLKCRNWWKSFFPFAQFYLLHLLQVKTATETGAKQQGRAILIEIREDIKHPARRCQTSNCWKGKLEASVKYQKVLIAPLWSLNPK